MFLYALNDVFHDWVERFFTFSSYFSQDIDARIVFAFLQKTTSVMCLVKQFSRSIANNFHLSRAKRERKSLRVKLNESDLHLSVFSFFFTLSSWSQRLLSRENSHRRPSQEEFGACSNSMRPRVESPRAQGSFRSNESERV